jgi:NADPH:quinone reductase-like Zn-dependent oxidoreductase
VRAASLNHRDLLVANGGYPGGMAVRDTIPLSDGAGEVVATGARVTRFASGDRVAATFFLGWTDGPPRSDPRPVRGVPVDGMLAELAVVREEDAVLVPRHLTDEEAATLPCAGVTAWHALMHAGRLKPGDSVLVLGSGGVSVIALQLAVAAGARVLMTSSSDEKLARGRALGADAGINYRRTPDWDREVLELTDGRGVDHVIEVGGPGTFARSLASVACDGHVSLIGFVAGSEGDTNPRPLMRKSAHLHGIYVGSRAMFEELNAAIEVNGVKPVIDRVFALDGAVEAYRHLASGAHFGKVVIRIGTAR